MRASCLAIVVLIVSGCTAEAPTQDTPGDSDNGESAAQDAAAADFDAGPKDPDSIPAPDTAAALDCDLSESIALFSVGVRPTIAWCRPCHDMELLRGMLKAPGPQWYHGTDDVAAVSAIVELGLINGGNPLASLFLVKPLGVDSGGLQHLGGGWFEAGSSEYEAFANFVQAAAVCAD